MRIPNKIAIVFILSLLIFSSCNKKDELIQEPKQEEFVPLNSVNDGVTSFVVGQNYLFRIFNYALVSALANPLLNGLQDDGAIADTRTCPTVTTDITSSPKTMVIDFGTNCSFANTLNPSATPDVISGKLTIQVFGAAVADNTAGSNTRLLFDELKINDTKIKFVIGDPVANWVKFEFVGDPINGPFFFNGKLDGSVPGCTGSTPDCSTEPSHELDCVYDRTHFEITNCITMDRTDIYPTYSGEDDTGVSFNMEYINSVNPGTPPSLDTATLFNASYAIGVNPVTALYHVYDDINEEYVLVEDYRIVRGPDPLTYQPRCKWVQAGELTYFDIQPMTPTNGEDYTDCIANDSKVINYGSNGIGGIDGNCDQYVLVTTSGGIPEVIVCPL